MGSNVAQNFLYLKHYVSSSLEFHALNNLASGRFPLIVTSLNFLSSLNASTYLKCYLV